MKTKPFLVLAAMLLLAAVPSAHAQTSKPVALPAQNPGGVKVFVKYYWTSYPQLKLKIGHLLLFPDGTAFDDISDEPLSSWSPAAIRGGVHPDEIGRWKTAGKKMVLAFPGTDNDRTLTKTARGWADPSGMRMKGPNYNLYFPAIPAPRARVLGAWKNESFMMIGEMGGGAAQVAAGSSGDWVFRADGTFAQSEKSFVSSTTANMGKAYKGDSDLYTLDKGSSRAAGRWRIDGPLLTLERNGKREVHLAFLLPEWGDDKRGTALMVDNQRWERPQKK